MELNALTYEAGQLREVIWLPPEGRNGGLNKALRERQALLRAEAAEVIDLAVGAAVKQRDHALNQQAVFACMNLLGLTHEDLEARINEARAQSRLELAQRAANEPELRKVVEAAKKTYRAAVEREDKARRQGQCGDLGCKHSACHSKRAKHAACRSQRLEARRQLDDATRAWAPSAEALEQLAAWHTSREAQDRLRVVRSKMSPIRLELEDYVPWQKHQHELLKAQHAAGCREGDPSYDEAARNAEKADKDIREANAKLSKLEAEAAQLEAQLTAELEEAKRLEPSQGKKSA